MVIMTIQKEKKKYRFKYDHKLFLGKVLVFVVFGKINRISKYCVARCWIGLAILSFSG